MSTYYLDTEFNEVGGELISLALVPDDNSKPELYLCRNDIQMMNIGPWVKNNVLPIIKCAGAVPEYHQLSDFSKAIYKYLKADTDIKIIIDWPDDGKYFFQCLITGPGTMVNLPGLRILLKRVDAYPTQLEGAVQHNALWDARALRELFQ